jgi:hypothetical protein
MAALQRAVWVLLAGLAVMGAAPPAGAPTVVPPVVPVTGKLGIPVALFNGKDLAGWRWYGPIATTKLEDVWSVKNGVLHCTALPGNATGYIDMDKEFKNFVLTVEYRHITTGNGGTFVCIHGTEKVFPDSIQIQGKFGNVGDLINQNTGMTKITTDPARTKTSGKDVIIARLAPPAPPVGKTAEMPMGQWNILIITMNKGNLSVTNNGVLLNTAADIAPDSGKIGIQAEGAEMEFRKVELTPIE